MVLATLRILSDALFGPWVWKGTTGLGRTETKPVVKISPWSTNLPPALAAWCMPKSPALQGYPLLYCKAAQVQWRVRHGPSGASRRRPESPRTTASQRSCHLCLRGESDERLLTAILSTQRRLEDWWDWHCGRPHHLCSKTGEVCGIVCADGGSGHALSKRSCRRPPGITHGRIITFRCSRSDMSHFKSHGTILSLWRLHEVKIDGRNLARGGSSGFMPEWLFIPFIEELPPMFVSSALQDGPCSGTRMTADVSLKTSGRWVDGHS